MSNKKTSKHKKNKAITDSEIKRSYAEYYHNKREVLSGETFRSRRRRGPEKAPSQYKARY